MAVLGGPLGDRAGMIDEDLEMVDEDPQDRDLLATLFTASYSCVGDDLAGR